MTNLCFSELMAKLKEMGYNYKVKLIKDKGGVEIYIMNDNMRIEAIIDLYEENDGTYTYEVKTRTMDDFMKLHDMMGKI